MAENDDLVGTWLRDDPIDASKDPYPMRLMFDANGMYRGEANAPDAFTLWDIGTFEVLDNDQIAISTATDAIVRYHFTLADNRLSFTDPTTDTTLTYRRADPNPSPGSGLGDSQG